MSSSKLVKCSTCNIVICEVLSFIQNKVDVMNEDSLVQICTTSFSVDDIEQAKSLLFESISTTKRRIPRKGDGRSKRDLHDVIAVFKETDPEEVPIFVARQLQKLPPVTFDHIDATRLLKDILVMQKDIRLIKETYVPIETLNEVKNDLFNLKQASLVNNYSCFVNNKRGGGGTSNSFCMDSGPVGLPHITHEQRSVSHRSPVAASASAISVSLSPARDDSPQMQASPGARHVEAPVLSTTASNMETTVALTMEQSGLIQSQSCIAMSKPVVEQKCIAMSKPLADPILVENESFANILSAEGQWKEERPREEWIVAQRRRLRNRLSTLEGKALTNPKEKFKAADLQTPLFINNVDSDTTEEDIVNYLFLKTKIKVSLLKIKAKVQRQYSAYKMFVPNSKISLFLDDNLWPEGISVRRFVAFRKNQDG